LDLESTIFAFPDDGTSLLGVNDRGNDNDDEEYRRFLEQQQREEEEDGAFDAYNKEDDDDIGVCSSDDEEEDLSEAVAGSANPNDGDDDDDTAVPRSSTHRRKAAARKRQQRLQEASREAEHRAKLQAAKAEEQAVQEMCTTHQLRLAMAVTISLKDKLLQVDNLLESLQEEQWADEEEAEEQATQQPRQHAAKALQQQRQPQLSLLDQVLAMILGASPPPEGTSLEDHVRFLEREHRTILAEWEKYFGRLPPPLTSSSTNSTADQDWNDGTTSTANMVNALPDATPQDRREWLGIVENHDEHWDSDEEDVEPRPVLARPVGLRPGGRLPPQ